MPRLFRNAHHHSLQLTQHAVVLSLPPQGDFEGPIPSSSAQHRIKEFLLHETPFRARGAPCYLTWAFASCLEREFPLRRFSHVVAGRRGAGLSPWRPARAGPAAVPP